MSDTKRSAILGKVLLDLLAPALDLDGQKVRRVVLDIPYDGAVKVYVERLADTRALEIQWPVELKNSIIT